MKRERKEWKRDRERERENGREFQGRRKSERVGLGKRADGRR